MTCPNRACRRTDPHDAKGCVVAWEAAWGSVNSALTDAARNTTGNPDRAYFMPRRFKP